jgi:hypothetical protein
MISNIILTILIIASFFAFFMINTSVFAVNSTITFFPPDSNPYGLSYVEHTKNFWKWILSFPIDKNPWEDAVGSNCDNGQSKSNSSIFYLSGNGGGISERKCIVPAGKSLFIPISQVEVSDKEVPHASPDDLIRIAKNDQDSVTSLYLSINDKIYEREELNKYRINTGVFDVFFPKDAIFGVTEGTSKAVADGYYIITKPIDKGNYTIQYKSSLMCLSIDCLEPNFAQDIKYDIIVK